MLLRHWRNPNTNTLFGVLGVSALFLRELLAMNAFNLRRALRGLTGSNVDEFNTRLFHVAAGMCVIAYCAKLD